MPVEMATAGATCSVALRSTGRKYVIKRTDIRRAMVLVDPKSEPRAAWGFKAEVMVLHHPTTIRPRCVCTLRWQCAWMGDKGSSS
jgi:GTPase